MGLKMQKIAMIQTVELARGIAAIMVVVFHANASADPLVGLSRLG